MRECIYRYGFYQISCFRSKTEIKSCRKLCSSEDTERIFCESSVVNMTYHTCGNVFLSAERIDYFACEYVLHHCIHREIAASCSIFFTDERIDKDFKVFMTSACCSLFSWLGDVYIVTFQIVYTEGSTLSLERTERRQNVFQFIGCYAVDFNVDIFIGSFEYLIADISADIVYFSASDIYVFRYFASYSEIFFNISHWYPAPLFMYNAIFFSYVKMSFFCFFDIHRYCLFK